MSGLESIAALGLACNILQLVELGKKTIDRIKTIYQGGKLDEELEQGAAGLEELAKEVRKDSQPVKKKYEEVLLKSAATCATAASDLSEEVSFLFENAKKESLVSALKVTTRVAWRQRRLERLKRNLEAEEKRMQTSLLAQVWSSTNAASIELSGVRRQLRFFIEQYRQGRRETTDLVSVESLNTRKHVSLEAKRINEAVGLVGQKVDRLAALEGAQMDERVRERFIDSLKYPGFNQRRNQIGNAYEDTLEWIFVGDNDESQPNKKFYEDETHTRGAEPLHEGFLHDIKWDSFSNWLSSTDVIYWISGKPGSGKTTVVKYILADERTKKYLDIWCPGCTIVSHYFWLPGSPMQRNMEGLLCSLLYQLLENNLNALMEVMPCVSGPKSSHTDWSHAELRLSVVKALDSYKNGVCLLLDGIDEIKPEDGTKDGIPEFLDWAVELSQRSKIKLCLASRPDPRILETRLSQYPRLRLQDLNYQDLMTYAQGRVKTPEKDISAQSEELIQSLADKAEGVFLWLILAIKSINEGFRNDDSVKTLQERIDCLPQGLDSLYKDMWARAGADNPAEYRQTAALYFKLLIASQILDLGEISAFDVMLATTCLADRVLHAIADRSKLVREDDMLQQCRKVEKKLNIYCVGLIQKVSVPVYLPYMQLASDCSWYGHVYDRIFPVAMRTRLEFIHRTARDFLTDTKLGHEILVFDTSSELSIKGRLLYARLAKSALFALEDNSVRNWSFRLEENLRIGARIGNALLQNELLQSWNQLVSVCEHLADSGRLLAGHRECTYRCSGTRFLNALGARHAKGGSGPVISRIKNRSPSESEKSSFLLASISGGVWDDNQPLFRTCREMLRAGADPNWQGWLERGSIPNAESGPHGVLQTPWRWLLVLTVRRLLCGRGSRDPSAPEPPPTELTSLAEVLLLFISEGARLSDPVNLAFRWSGIIWDLETFEWGDIYGHTIFASIPACMIVKLLANCLRYFFSTSDTVPFLKICANLENACESHRSSGKCRVIGKSENKNDSLGEYSWWETTSSNEVQSELGRKLMEWLEGQSLFSGPVIEGADISSEERMRDFKKQTFQYIWDHESWTLRTRETGISSICERLVELGFMMSLDGIVEFHSHEEWVRKHSLLGEPQYGGAT